MAEIVRMPKSSDTMIMGCLLAFFGGMSLVGCGDDPVTPDPPPSPPGAFDAMVGEYHGYTDRIQTEWQAVTDSIRYPDSLVVALLPGSDSTLIIGADTLVLDAQLAFSEWSLTHFCMTSGGFSEVNDTMRLARNQFYPPPMMPQFQYKFHGTKD